MLGPESWAQEAWGVSRDPLCPRKALKWGTDPGGSGVSPKYPKGERRGMTKQGGSYMPVVWGNETGEAQILLPTLDQGWAVG